MKPAEWSFTKSPCLKLDWLWLKSNLTVFCITKPHMRTTYETLLDYAFPFQVTIRNWPTPVRIPPNSLLSPPLLTQPSVCGISGHHQFTLSMCSRDILSEMLLDECRRENGCFLIIISHSCIRPVAFWSCHNKGSAKSWRFNSSSFPFTEKLKIE